MTPEESDSDCYLAQYAELFDQANQLDPEGKIALIRRLMTHLEPAHLQNLLEFGQQAMANRQHEPTGTATAMIRQTTLLLKKDYSYQKRGLSQPTQYYVYLRRRKPKLDRYVGSLFYVPQGCMLSYFPDAEGRIIFTSPHNAFTLKDFTNPSLQQVVRLICLEPPPADYTFTKQQGDVPKIQLRLEHLDLDSHQPISEASYAFPFCMYEGGKLDRYRWDVSPLMLSEVDPKNWTGG
jgi:hypothetical protein